MSDIGNALVSGLSSMGSSLGDMFSGVGNAMTGAGGDVGTMFGQMAQALSPSGGGSASAPVIDPAAAAPLALTPPAGGTPQQQAGQVGGTQSGGAPQPATGPQTGNLPPSSNEVQARAAGIDAIRKLFAQGRRNPYQAGGGTDDPMGTWEGEGGAPAPNPRVQPPWFKWAGGKPYQPSAQPQSDEPVDIPDFRRNPAAMQAGQGAVDQAVGRNPTAQAAGETAVGDATAPDGLGPLARNPRAAAAGQSAVGGAVAPTEGGGLPAVQPPEIGPGSAAAAAGVPPIVSQLARASPLGVGAAALSPTPAETGELPPGGFQSKPGTTIAGPASEVLREGEGGQAPGQLPNDPGTTPTKGDYEKWLKQQGVTPSEAKKKADKSSPAERKQALPTKVPTKKPGLSERPYHMDQPPPGQSGMMRDVAGMQGVPQMLGALAQIALPLIGGLMSGGGGRPFGGHHGFGGFPFGRGGHGRFGGPWRGGHPGGFGSGMWPYHHPGMGWRGFGFHPGGQWQPLHPQFGPGGGGMGGGALGYGGGGASPIMDIISQFLGGGMGGGGGFRRGGGFGNSEPVNGPWSGNPFYSTLVGAESGGRNSGGPGGGPAGDNGLARGYFNIQTPTWSDFAPRVPGASRYASADQAPYEIQRAVANTIPVYRFGDRTKRILHAKFGNFDERLTVGQMADKAGGVQSAANIPTTPTGDTRVAAQ